MAIRTVKKSAVGTITQDKKGVGQTFKEVKSKPITLDDQHCTVTVALGHTRNLGNFESLRVDVSIAYPCNIGEEDETFDKAQNWVNAKMTELLDD